MPNWIAITWENDRLMLLVAGVHNGTPTFERSACFTLQSPVKAPAFGDADDESETSETARSRNVSLKKQLADFIEKHRLQKSEVVVVLSRSDVEVRPMLFPPVPFEELPDLVRFQATKEFNGYDATAPLDFFITNKLENVTRSTLFPAVGAPAKQTGAAAGVPSGAPKHLIASTLRPATYRKIREFCEELNLVLRRIVLRPCETAYLLRQSKNFDPGRSVLLVELDSAETSQAVLFQGEPVFMRSPKIGCPEEDVSASDFAARLVAELKRTRIAVRNEIQGVTVDEVVLCGVGKNFESLAKQVSDGLAIPVKTFDPWSGLDRGGELRAVDARLDMPERYASLLGAILQGARNEPDNIDFCNPKKRPEPAGHRNLVTGALAAGLLLLVCLLGYGFYTRMTLMDEVRKLNNRVKELQRTAVTVTEQRNQLTAIDTWLADDVDWFEQLDWLSRKAPGSQDMILTELTLLADHGGVMRLKSLLKDASVVSPMELRLREDNHDIKPGEKRESPSNSVSPIYGYRYDLTVTLSRDPSALDEAMPEEIPPTDEPPSGPEEAKTEPAETEPTGEKPSTEEEPPKAGEDDHE